MSKTLLECRGMTWGENCDFEEFRDELVRANQDMSAKKIIGKLAEWVFEHVYKEVDINQFTAAEVFRIYQTTIAKSNDVREEEIKNLLPLAIGSATEEATAQTAEESANA
ncbi:MAG: hypothetical protein IJ516_05605 [Phascolarctobacterium sp.]|nr:hypothetical protein [Phascolarctobacterium sp.]